jgi:hypothetical protein
LRIDTSLEQAARALAKVKSLSSRYIHSRETVIIQFSLEKLEVEKKIPSQVYCLAMQNFPLLRSSLPLQVLNRPREVINLSGKKPS